MFKLPLLSPIGELERYEFKSCGLICVLAQHSGEDLMIRRNLFWRDLCARHMMYHLRATRGIQYMPRRKFVIWSPNPEEDAAALRGSLYQRFQIFLPNDNLARAWMDEVEIDIRTGRDLDVYDAILALNDDRQNYAAVYLRDFPLLVKQPPDMTPQMLMGLVEGREALQSMCISASVHPYRPAGRPLSNRTTILAIPKHNVQNTFDLPVSITQSPRGLTSTLRTYPNRVVPSQTQVSNPLTYYLV